MARRRAVLVVEYEVVPENLVPDAHKWERVFGGSGIKRLYVEVQEDKAL